MISTSAEALEVLGKVRALIQGKMEGVTEGPWFVFEEHPGHPGSGFSGWLGTKERCVASIYPKEDSTAERNRDFIVFSRSLAPAILEAIDAAVAEWEERCLAAKAQEPLTIYERKNGAEDMLCSFARSLEPLLDLEKKS